MTEPDRCYRCGGQGERTETFTVRTLGGDVFEMGGAGQCATPGCAEPNGSRRLTAPSPEELRRREEDAWLARQREMAT